MLKFCLFLALPNLISMKTIYFFLALLFALMLQAQDQHLEKFPSNPQPGKCYVKHTTPDEFEIKTFRILEVPAYKVIEVIPAEYKVVQDEVVVKPASKKYKFIPATYTTTIDTFWVEEPYNKIISTKAVLADDFEEIELRSKSGKWEVRQDPNCLSSNPDDCSVFHYREDPAVMRSIPVKRLVVPAKSSTKQVGGKFKLVERQVIATPAHTLETLIPEVKEVVERRVLVKDETTREIEVPATYTTVEKRIVTKQGGMAAWKEVPCTLPKNAIILPINYELGSARITAKSKSILDKHILPKLKEDKNTVVEIESHTDSRGSKTSNQDLS